MKFTELVINNRLQQKIIDYHFSDLTPIQNKCIPEILKGKDVVGKAETGSGKTLAFCLPILDMVHPNHKSQVLVLTPTRELCIQVGLVFKDFGKDLGIQVSNIFGGVNIVPQIREIKQSDIIVATPGRLLDHISRKTIDLRSIRFLVLDEIDKMLDMGFIDDVERIISYLTSNRQNLMFSAK
jgi:superfamily II DNA/RNA helicase